MISLTCREIANAVDGTLFPGDREATVCGISIDSRTVKDKDLFVPLKGENADGHRFIEGAFKNGAAASFCEYPYKKEYDNGIVIVVDDTLAALQKAAAYYRSKFDVQIAAVTGSSGKTTTKDLLATVLRPHFSVLKTEGNFNNHIGLPLTLFNLEPEHDVAVLEMAMRGPGEIGLLTKIARPQWAVLTNIGDAHIERLGSVENIAAAKGELLAEMDKSGNAILNGDDPFLRRLGSEYDGKVYYYGFGKDADFNAGEYSLSKEGSSFKLSFPDGNKVKYSLPIPGKHNVSNALAALALGYLMGIEPENMDFFSWSSDASAGRLQTQTSSQGALIIDDTYNANPVSMKASLQILADMNIKGRKFAVLGDMLELGDFSRDKHREIGEKVGEAGLDLLITVGAQAAYIGEEAGKRGVETEICANNKEAWSILGKIALTPHDAVFLKGSRGMKLEELVEKLK